MIGFIAKNLANYDPKNQETRKLETELRKKFKKDIDLIMQDGLSFFRGVLEKYRNNIDEIDNEIIGLLANNNISKEINLENIDYDEGFDEFIKDFWEILYRNGFSDESIGIEHSNNQEIINLLKARFICVKKIGEIKKILNMPPLSPARWEQVLGKVKGKASNNGIENGDFIEELWNRIHKYSLFWEGKIKEGDEIKTVYAK